MLSPLVPAVALSGRLTTSPAGLGSGQRFGFQHLPPEGGPEREPVGRPRSQDAQQGPPDQYNTEVCVCLHQQLEEEEEEGPSQIRAHFSPCETKEKLC